MVGLNWLASYPRSGNTWTRLLLWTLRHGQGVDLAALADFGRMAVGRALIDDLMECDTGVMTAEETRALRPHVHVALAIGDPGRIVKVHDAWQRLADGRPVHDPAITHATIYIVRDPRDVAVSWARFQSISLDRAIDWLARRDATLGQSPFAGRSQVPQQVGSWSDNVTTWIDDSGMDPLVVRYEDLLADTPVHLRRIAGRLGWDASDEAIELAVRSSRFDRVADMERRTGFVERPATAKSFFRAGRAGGWQTALSDDQAARILDDHGLTMARFGYC